MGEEAVFLAVRTVDEVPQFINGLGIGTHSCGTAPGAVEDGIEEARAQVARLGSRSEHPNVLANNSAQVSPDLWKSDRFTAWRAMTDSRAVLHADHNRV